MAISDRANILLVDDQPAKLLSYELILSELGENLLKASSGREALEHLLRNDVAVILVDVVMPDLDGFQLAQMIREHPRFQRTAIIFISAVQFEDVDRIRGYQLGAVDYVPVPVIPDVLRAKVRVFVELFRKTRELEALNRELERRVAERTAELQASTARLQESERRRTLALAAGRMGSWDWDLRAGECLWDDGQCQIFGVDPARFAPSVGSVAPLIHPEDRDRLRQVFDRAMTRGESCNAEFRIVRPNGEVRWCIGAAAPSMDAEGRPARVSGVTVDITDRKEAEERQALLAREVDHRARNALAVVQSILRLSRAESAQAFVEAVDGRIRALARAHTLLSQSRWQGAHLARLVEEELAPYRTGAPERIAASGPVVFLRAPTAQALALALHELATNAAKYGALSTDAGRVTLAWEIEPDRLWLRWTEVGGPAVVRPSMRGFGARMIEAAIERELGGRADFAWRPEGLECLLAIPANHVVARVLGPPDLAQGGQRSDSAGAAEEAAGGRILLVEDESLIAMMMREMLAELGFVVVGPFGELGAALDAARTDALDAAVLDLNLDGRLVHPVADALAERGVPFVLVTGYDSESVGESYTGVPVLQKPIEPQALRRQLRRMLARKEGRSVDSGFGGRAARAGVAARPGGAANC